MPSPSWPQPRPLTPAAPESLEGAWAATGATLGFLDLRGQPASAWTRTAVLSAPLGYAPMIANWSDVLDGMVYTKTMVESRKASH